MAATYRSASITQTDFVTPVDPWSITGPAGAASGDWVVIMMEFFDAEGLPDSVPAGFTQGPTAEEGPDDGRGVIYYGLFSTVGAGPYSFGFATTAQGIGITLAVSGADLTAPLNVASTALDGTAAGTTWACTGQTTTVAGCCIVGVGGASPNGPGRTWAITAGTTQRLFAVITSHVLVVGTLDQSAAGAVTTSGTNTVTDQTYGLQMAFAPALASVRRPTTLQSGLSW